MRKLFALVMCIGIAITILAENTLAKDKVLTMSTTTSTQASGLLDVLLPEFEKDTGIRVKVIAKGTGAAIKDGRDGNVDVIFVHAKAREEKFIQEGYGTQRYAVMHNDFIIVGPPDDPANLKGIIDAAFALKKIAGEKAKFISRGDDSGTHTKEQSLWRKTGLPLEEKTTQIIKKGKKRHVSYLYPQNGKDWYLSIGQGMGKTLTFADEKGAYALVDRGTYIKYKFGRKAAIDLEIVCEGDPDLINRYGVIPISPVKHPHVKHALARTFAEWLISKRGQNLIRNYKLLGKQLFFPDAMQ